MIYQTRRKYSAMSCADFSDTKWAGNSYVYIWMDENNKPFYVGSGSGTRATSVAGSRRSKMFMDKVNKDCWIWFIAEGLEHPSVLDVERQAVIFLTKQGFALCQKAYTNTSDRYCQIIPNEIIYQRCQDVFDCVSRVGMSS